jgi:hypothetical protein
MQGVAAVNLTQLSNKHVGEQARGWSTTWLNIAHACAAPYEFDVPNEWTKPYKLNEPSPWAIS